MRTVSRTGRWIVAACIVFVVIVIGVAVSQYLSSPGTDLMPVDLARDARRALERGSFEESLRLSEQLLDFSPRDSNALLLAGEAATHLSRYDAALEFYNRIASGQGPNASVARWAAGEVSKHLGRASDAEGYFREALRLDPDSHSARRELALLLATTGRRRESLEHFFLLVRADRLTVETLLFLGNGDKIFEAEGELKRYREAAPEDRLPDLGLARIALEHGDAERAVGLLEPLVEARPELIEARVQLGLALLHAAPHRLAAWQAELTPPCLQSPDIWFVQGMWAELSSQPDSAARCFWEAARRDPNHRAAHYHLAQSHSSFLDASAIARVARRAEQLQDFTTNLNIVFQGRSYLPALQAVAQLAAELGRDWESRAWCAYVLSQSPGTEWAEAGMRAADQRLRGGDAEFCPTAPWTYASANVAAAIDLAKLPVPSGRRSIAICPPEAPRATASKGIRFQRVDAAVGLDFTYYASREPPTRAHHMYEFTGGGVAVLDYDTDGWPDLCFTQGSQWPPAAETSRYHDQLYRNDGPFGFTNVTINSYLDEGSFSQGAAVGDINNDGFDDLYVGNIGRNRLFVNNGDGTFLEIAQPLLPPDEVWTTSCAIADLNGDGSPDIYDANYVTGDNVYELLCDTGGQSRVCSPLTFAPQRDRLLASRGDGEFVDATDRSGVAVPLRMGLGIVVARLDHDLSLDVFLANDQVANTLLRNQSSPGGDLQFVDQALLSGVAFDASGRAQACMGVAADDYDGDGLLDLFVTNFYQEPNTLYHQREGGVFADNSVRAGLAAASLKQLGFGTQFVDVQLDGHPDLVVVNGHIDDLTHMGIPNEMPPQLFVNGGDGGFTEIADPQLGSYFENPVLGRGLARIDWNRDGREDFAVSHLGTPAALVENRSDAGNFLQVRLRGVESSRDAIGTIVIVEIGEHRWTRQLTAGDGYFASNQRQLVFGLGNHLEIDRMTVHWPSGLQQTFDDIGSLNREMLVIEGSAAVVPLRGPLVRE